MNANYYKTITNKNKSYSTKDSNKNFQVKNPLKSIYSNKSYALSGINSNSSNDIKNNDFSLFQHKILLKNKKNQGKENNISAIKKNNIIPLQGINAKKSNKSFSNYNIFTTPHINTLHDNENFFEGMALAKVKKINNQPKKITLTKNMNRNDLNNNYRSYKNIINRNNNLNQFYGLNLINKNQLNNNNILTNQKSINNNYLTMPRVNNNSQILPITSGLSTNDNSQTIIENDDEQRSTTITDIDRYFINSDVNIENERLTTGYKTYNREGILTNELTMNYNDNTSMQNNHYLNNILNSLNSSQTSHNELQNSSLNDIINQLTTNNQHNTTYNNYLENLQNNYSNLNPYIKFLKNYTQNRKKRNNKGEVLLTDFGAITHPGSDEHGLSKVNQDAYISKTNINGINDFNIFGVLDGHGDNGHFVSEFVSQFIPNKIITHSEIKNNSKAESIYNKLIQDDYKIIKEAFMSTDKELSSMQFNCNFSGTTCVIIIHIGNHLICANVGDSRAIVVFDEQNDSNLNFLRAIPLSIDSKPDLPEENGRIICSGGMVRQMKNSFGEGIGPYRVYAQGKDFPGLAMSRSIGDLIGKKLGIISEPGVTEYFIGSNTKFFVLCSDGVWDFLSNDKVKDIGKQFYLNSNATELCQEIVSSSLIEWQTHDIFVDDITAVAGFF